MRRKADAWLYISIFICIFGRVYEGFSHEIYSFKMIYAFGFALIFGCLVRVWLAKSSLEYMPGYLTNSIYNAGIVTMTLGAILDGILYIYGTASEYIRYYYLVGAGLILFAVILFTIGVFVNREEW